MMALNRRGLLALIGGAAVAPTAGVKQAAKALGMDTVVGSALGGAPSDDLPMPSGARHHWYGSMQQVAFSAKEAARGYEMKRYDHMKSWGHGFRQSVIEREVLIEMVFRSKCEQEEGFMAKVFGLIQ